MKTKTKTLQTKTIDCMPGDETTITITVKTNTFKTIRIKVEDITYDKYKNTTC